MTLTPDFEPFRLKTVEPITITTPNQRRRFLAEADYNLFRLKSEQVMIDLLSDSGTSAMSSRQVAAMMHGDESFAGSASFHKLADVVKQVFGMPHMLPTHQGRIAERLLVESVIGKTPTGRGLIVPNNAHFDTTRYMIEASGAEAVNLIGSDEFPAANRNEANEKADARCSFLGDMDVRSLENLLATRGDDVPFVMLTLTCNSNGGQPVSLRNLRQVREVCDRHGKMLFLDACRFAENAWFIMEREGGKGGVASTVRAIFDLADGVVMSARKDALCNAGGLLLMRHEHFYRRACNLCVLTEGFQMTYGSLPGRDLEAIAVGLQEALDETYLASRIEMIRLLADELARGDVPVLQPAGGHAVFLDADAFCPHLSRADSPGHSLACAIYQHSGIRCSRVGSVLRTSRGEPREIVRLAVPRRTYTQSHIQYVARAIVDLKSRASGIEPIKAAPPAVIRMEEPLLATA